MTWELSNRPLIFATLLLCFFGYYLSLWSYPNVLCQLEALVSSEAREAEFQVYCLFPHFYHPGHLKSSFMYSTSDYGSAIRKLKLPLNYFCSGCYCGGSWDHTKMYKSGWSCSCCGSKGLIFCWTERWLSFSFSYPICLSMLLYLPHFGFTFVM